MKSQDNNQIKFLESPAISFGSGEQGFSLIEMLIVVSIMIIMTAIAVSAFMQPRLYGPEDQAIKVMEFIRNAQQLAITQRSQMQLEIGYQKTLTSPKMMRVSRVSDGVEQSLAGLNPLVLRDKPPSVSTRPNPPNYSDASADTWTAYVNPDGTIVAAPTDAVPVSATFYFYVPDEGAGTARAVTMFGGTGAVRIWRYGASCTNNWCN